MRRGALLRWTARTMPGVEDAIRRDLVASLDAMAERSGRIGRAMEVGSLVGLGLRSMSRRGALDDRRELIRQGLRVGGLVLAIVGALLACASGHDASSLVLSGCASLTAIAIAAGLRVGALALAGATVLLQVATEGSPTSLSLLVLGAVAAGQRFDAQRCPVGGALCATALVIGGIAAAFAPAPAAATLVTTASLAVSGGLLAVGWFDPRYAVAATFVWLWRFIAVDINELGQAIGGLGDHAEFRLLIGRWLLMGICVLIGWQVSKAAIRRCLTVFR